MEQNASQLNDVGISNLNEAINIFLYAKKFNIKKVCKNGKFSHKVQIYLLETNSNILQWISENKQFPKSRIFISNIASVSSTAPYPLNAKKFNLDGILSIQYREKGFLVLEFQKKEDKCLFEKGLNYFIQLQRQKGQPQIEFLIIILQIESVENSPTQHVFTETFAAKLFDQADINKEGYLEFQQIQIICEKLHLRLHTKFLLPFFKNYSEGNKILKENFQKLVLESQIKSELKDLFERYCSGAKQNYLPNESLMTPSEFLQFCQHEQFEFNVTLEQVSDLMEMFNSLENPQEKNISYLTFCNMIFNQVNSIFDSKKKMIYQNMTWPLNQYFIKSTNFKCQPKITEQQCVNQYINVVKFGYRYIEIDCWDGPYGEPNLFPEDAETVVRCELILEAIANNGFENNSYPLIVGLNVQCGEIQQDRLAELIQKYFGELLYILPQGCSEMQDLPSPEELQNKILIHCFKLFFFIQLFKKAYGEFEQACQQIQGQQYVETDIDTKKFRKFGSKGVTDHLLKTLSLFGKKIGLEKHDSYNSIFNLNCLSTKKLNKLLVNKEAQLIQFNKKYMTKIASFTQNEEETVFNPFDGFLSGSQISCIGDSANEMDLYYYESKFQENGGINSGYVLKPYFMRPELTGIVCPSLDFQEIQQEIILNIISAHQIITPEENEQLQSYSLEVSMVNGRNESEQKVESDHVVSDGFKIEFKNLTAKFTICCPELSMIIFKVKYENELLGFYGIPVQCIRSGYRMIPVRNSRNLEIMENSSIFVYVIVKEIK